MSHLETRFGETAAALGGWFFLGASQCKELNNHFMGGKNLSCKWLCSDVPLPNIPFCTYLSCLELSSWLCSSFVGGKMPLGSPAWGPEGLEMPLKMIKRNWLRFGLEPARWVRITSPRIHNLVGSTNTPGRQGGAGLYWEMILELTWNWMTPSWLSGPDSLSLCPSPKRLVIPLANYPPTPHLQLSYCNEWTWKTIFNRLQRLL